jgi:hypothetical protein
MFLRNTLSLSSGSKNKPSNMQVIIYGSFIHWTALFLTFLTVHCFMKRCFFYTFCSAYSSHIRQDYQVHKKSSLFHFTECIIIHLSHAQKSRRCTSQEAVIEDCYDTIGRVGKSDVCVPINAAIVWKQFPDLCVGPDLKIYTSYIS